MRLSTVKLLEIVGSMKKVMLTELVEELENSETIQIDNLN